MGIDHNNKLDFIKVCTDILYKASLIQSDNNQKIEKTKDLLVDALVSEMRNELLLLETIVSTKKIILESSHEIRTLIEQLAADNTIVRDVDINQGNILYEFYTQYLEECRRRNVQGQSETFFCKILNELIREVINNQSM